MTYNLVVMWSVPQALGSKGHEFPSVTYQIMHSLFPIWFGKLRDYIIIFYHLPTQSQFSKPGKANFSDNFIEVDYTVVVSFPKKI